MVWRGSPDSTLGGIVFGYITPHQVETDCMDSVAGYFSTQFGAMVRVTALRHDGSTVVPVTSVVVGASGESWSNRHVAIGSTNGPFDMLQFEGVSSRDDLLAFCVDDLTYTPVPEPSSLAALSLGLLAAGAGVRRRRRAT